VLYHLRSLITLYEGHYTCYYYDEARRQWWKLDDGSVVRAVGESLNAVKANCVHGREQPVTLFFHRARGESTQW